MRHLPRALLPIYATTLVETLGYTLMIPLLPAIVQKYHASDVMSGALLSVPALCSMLAAPIWGKLSDRLGRKTIILIAQLLTLAGYLLQATAPTLLWIFIARIISGSGGGALGAVQSYIADVTKEEQRDLAYSLYGAVFGVAFIIGPVMSGFLIRSSLAVPFLVAAGIEVAMDLSLATVSRQHCVGVVLATADYPRSNTPLAGLCADVALEEGCHAFWGASQRTDGSVSTGGGRVLTVTALGDDLSGARIRAYGAVQELAARLGTDALTYRTDIAQLA